MQSYLQESQTEASLVSTVEKKTILLSGYDDFVKVKEQLEQLSQLRQHAEVPIPGAENPFGFFVGEDCSFSF